MSISLLAAAQSACMLALVLVAPWLDRPATRRLRANPTTPARLTLFKRIAAGLWIGAVLCTVASGGIERLWTLRRAPGEWHWLDTPALMLCAATLTTAFFAFGFWPALRCLRDGSARQRYAPHLRSLAYLLPTTPSERRWWIAVSLSAGICEEIVFRGFVLQYLRGTLEGGMPLGFGTAVLLSSAIFGLNHLYQGAGGILRTAILGLACALAAVLSGSLLLPIVLHCLCDLATLAMHNPAADAKNDASTAHQLPAATSAAAAESQAL